MDAIEQILERISAHDQILNRIISHLEEKIMVTLADIQTALASDEAAEQKVIALLQTQAADISSLAAQLSTALASNDQTAMQAVVDQMNADAKTMTDAVAAATPAQTTSAPAPATEATPEPAAPATEATPEATPEAPQA